MNFDHLRKQAKNLKSLFPELVEAHGNSLTLSQAQAAIAKTHGYPSWAAALACSGADSNPRAKQASSGKVSSVEEAIRDGYVFHLSQEMKLTIELDENARPKRHAKGREALLSFRRREDQQRVNELDEILDELTEQMEGMTGEFADYTDADLTKLIDSAKSSVKQCPLHIEAWNTIAGAMFTLGQFAEAMAIAEPVATTLLSLLPTSGRVQVCYGDLANRPFYRIVHCYLLLLHETGRHKEADQLARRMYAFWPNDNMGFRFMLTREDRDAG